MQHERSGLDSCEARRALIPAGFKETAMASQPRLLQQQSGFVLTSGATEEP